MTVSKTTRSGCASSNIQIYLRESHRKSEKKAGREARKPVLLVGVSWEGPPDLYDNFRGNTLSPDHTLPIQGYICDVRINTKWEGV